jgi:hypothetical protein
VDRDQERQQRFKQTQPEPQSSNEIPIDKDFIQARMKGSGEEGMKGGLRGGDQKMYRQFPRFA